MKKSIILTGAIAFAISFQSCQSGDNGAQLAKDNAAIDSVANAKGIAFTDSLNMECLMAATTRGMEMGDSMVNASKKGGKGGGKPKTTTVVTPPPPPPSDPKKDKMSGNSQSNADAKKDKMSGSGTNTNTDAKKDKMGGKPK